MLTTTSVPSPPGSSFSLSSRPSEEGVAATALRKPFSSSSKQGRLAHLSRPSRARGLKQNPGVCNLTSPTNPRIIPLPMLTSEQSEKLQQLYPETSVPYDEATLIRNLNTINNWLPKWFHNLRENGTVISRGFEEGRFSSVADISTKLQHRDLSKSIVVGSGPSANLLLECDLQKWDGLVICGSSNASLLAAAGRPADIILAVDSAEELYLHLYGCPHEANGSLLLTHPYIHPRVLSLWSSGVVFYHSHIPYGIHPFNTFVEYLYPMINGFMVQSGCTVNQEITFHTFLSEGNRQPWKTTRIFLCGVDFSYPQTSDGSYNERCHTYRFRNGTYIQNPTSAPRPRSTLFPYKERLTDSASVGYKNSLMVLYKLLYLPLYDCSDGIISELPKYDIREVVETNGRVAKEQPAEEIHARWMWYKEHNQKEEERLEGTEEIEEVVVPEVPENYPSLP
jgi:hypothetical protein